jgi:hypothetical protein
MRRLPPLWLLAVLALAATTRSAHADDPRVTALIEEGLDLRQAQRDAEALVLFEKAQALAPSPRGQAQVALAQQALGRWKLAEENLRAALGAKDDAWIESRRAILERALTVILAHLGDVEIVGARSGTVYVDGVPSNDAHALSHLRLEVGRRTLEIRAAGAYPFSRLLEVLPGETVRVEVEQRPLLVEPSIAPVAIAPSSQAPTPIMPASSAEVGRAQRTIGWTFLGGAGLFLASGFAGLGVRAAAVTDFNATESCTGVPTSALSSQCRSWLNQGSTGQTLEVVGFVGGGLLAVVSVTLLVTAPSATKTSAPVASAASLATSCAPTAGGAWCSLGGAF